MSGDVKKAAAVAGATMTTTGSTTAAALAGTTEFLTGMVDRLDRLRRRKLHTWWERVIQESDKTKEELESEVFEKLSQDSDKLASVVLKSARAAQDSIDSAALVPLAVLTQSYLAQKKRPDLFFRGVSSLLSNITAVELKCLRKFLAQPPPNQVIGTNIIFSVLGFVRFPESHNSLSKNEFIAVARLLKEFSLGTTSTGLLDADSDDLAISVLFHKNLAELLQVPREEFATPGTQKAP